MERESKESAKVTQQSEQSEKERVTTPSPQPEDVATPSLEQETAADTDNASANRESDASAKTRKDDSLQNTVESILKTFLTDEKQKQRSEQERVIYNFNFVQGHNYGSMVGGDNVGNIGNGAGASVSPNASPEEKSVENTVKTLLRSPDSVTRSALIMLAMLEYVPSDIFNEMTCDLCRCLTGDEELNVSFLWRAQDLLSGIPLTEGSRNPYLYVNSATVWVGFQDETLADWIRALIWKGQRQLRKVVLEPIPKLTFMRPWCYNRR